MHLKNRDRGLRLGVLVLLGLLAVGGATVGGQEPVPPPRPDPRVGRNPSIVIPIGGSQQLQMSTKKAISSVYLSGEGVARVAAGPNNQFVVISGLAAGAVQLKLTDVDGKDEWFDIVVQLDTTYVKQLISRAVPTSNVEVIPTTGRLIILTGWVAKAEDVDTVLRVAGGVIGTAGGAAGGGGSGGTGASASGSIINAIRVGGVQQVQLDVVVASVNRTEARRRGFNFSVNGGTVSVGSILGGLTSSGGGGAGQAATGINISGVNAIPNAPPAGANLVLGIVPWRFQGLLQALKDESLAKLLAEPKVVAISGRPASFLSGGQAAVLSTGGSIGGPGVDFRDVGTELQFLPIVLGNGRIYLEVAPRFRAINIARGITTSFGFVPGFDEQSVRTAVELEPGQTMAIGGLIQTTVSSAASRVPVLGSLPFVGGAFSTVFHNELEEELVILVTPHLVDGMDCNQAPKRLPGRETRSPDDYELFLEGILEAPRGQRNVFEGNRYKAAYKNDPSYGQFPCADPQDRQKKGKTIFPNGCPPNGNGNCGTTGGCAPGMVDPAAAPQGGPAMPPPMMPPDGAGREVLPPPAADNPGLKIGGPAKEDKLRDAPAPPLIPTGGPGRY